MALKHEHKFTIGDHEAFATLLAKATRRTSRPQRRERLLQALDDAARRYKASNDRERNAFLHGLLTGYAVALKLW